MEHTRAWRAGETIEPTPLHMMTVAPNPIFEPPPDFIESQARAWMEIRDWSDDQIPLMPMREGGSPNGPGASLDLTVELREQLPELLVRHHIISMLDVACGDWNWMRLVDLGRIQYLGWDVDPTLVERCARRIVEGDFVKTDYAHNEIDATFECVNALTVPEIPMVDLILCRDLLGHFPNEYIATVLNKFALSDSTFLLASTYPDADNQFTYHPDDYAWLGYMEHPVDLQQPPFSMGNPIEVIPEATGPSGVLAVPHELALFRLQ